MAQDNEQLVFTIKSEDATGNRENVGEITTDGAKYISHGQIGEGNVYDNLRDVLIDLSDSDFKISGLYWE